MVISCLQAPSSRRWGQGIASFAVMAALLLTGCDETSAQAEATAHSAMPKVVRVESVDARDRQVTHRFSGRVEAVQTIDLSFRVAGRLAKLSVKEGHVVKKGDLIAALDPTDFERAVREAKVGLNLAQQEYERAVKLRERGAVAEKTLDQAKATRDLAAVALDDAQQDVAYTRLVAPFDALITKRLAENFTNVAAGSQVVRIQDVTEIQIDVDAPEALLSQVEKSEVITLEAEFPALPDVRFPLEYREHSSEPNAVTQTYRVTLAMPQQDGLRVLPGMTASVFVTLATKGGDAVSVPLTAVAADENKVFFVWVYDQGAKTVSKRAVTIGPVGDGVVPVLSGLNGGEEIVTAGVSRLHEGMSVRPAEIR